MTRMVITVAVIAILGYAGVCTALFFLQERLLFFPRPVFAHPTHPDIEPFGLRAADRTELEGWVVNPGSSDAPVVVYFGGNGEELSTSTESFLRLPATSILVNYRGYGDSQGRPGETALLADGLEVIEAARERFGSRPLVLFGRSLGTGIAAHAAARLGVDGLILMSPYRSITHLARQVMPAFPVAWLLRHRFETENLTHALPAGILVIIADDDRVVPTAESDALAALLTTPRMVRYQGGHNVSLRHPVIGAALEDYLAGISRS